MRNTINGDESNLGQNKEQSVFQIARDQFSNNRPKTASFRRTNSVGQINRPSSSYQHKRSVSLQRPTTAHIERISSSKTLNRPTTAFSRSEGRQDNRYFEFEARIKEAPTILKLAD